MNLVLNIYTDDTLTELKRVAEADRLKIPYRVALTVAQSLDDLNLDDEKEVLNLISGNVDKVDKVLKATFGVTDTELECVDLMEMGSIAKEIYSWAIGKFTEIKGGNDSKNE